MLPHPTTRRSTHAVGAFAIATVLALQPLALPKSGSSFVLAKRYPSPTGIPGAISCVGAHFCMQVAASGPNPVSVTSVLTTHDAGASWSLAGPIPLAALDGTAQTLQCVAPDVCFAGGGQVLAKTTDGGTVWTLKLGLPRRWSLGHNVTCLANGACLAVGVYGKRVRTEWLAPGAKSFRPINAVLPDGLAADALDCLPARCVLTGTLGLVDGVTLVGIGVGPSLRWHQVGERHGWVTSAVSCPTPSRCYGIVVHERVITQHLRSGTHRFVRDGGVYVARSTQGGAAWQFVAHASGRALPAAITCASATVCATSIGTNDDGGYGIVFIGVAALVRHAESSKEITSAVTTDGGASWHTHAVLTADGYAGVSGSTSCFRGGTCLADAAELSGGGRTLSISSSGTTTELPTLASPVGATSVVCTTGDTCYRVDTKLMATGYASTLLVSHDDAATWSPVVLPAGESPVLVGGCQSALACEVVAVSGVTLEHGQLGVYAYGASRIDLLVTADGGATWSVSEAAGAEYVPLGASCASATQCSVLTSVTDATTSTPDYLFSTQDASTWTSTPVPSPQLYFLDLFYPFGDVSSSLLSCAGTSTCLFADPNLQSGSELFRSTDGGATWIVATPPGPAGDNVDGLACVAAATCVALYSPGQRGPEQLVETTDGGATWSAPKAVPGGEVSVLGFSCASTVACTEVRITRSGTSSVATTDGGTTWATVGWPKLVSRFQLLEEVPALSCSATTCAALYDTVGFTLAHGFESVAELLRTT